MHMFTITDRDRTIFANLDKDQALQLSQRFAKNGDLDYLEIAAIDSDYPSLVIFSSKGRAYVNISKTQDDLSYAFDNSSDSNELWDFPSVPACESISAPLNMTIDTCHAFEVLASFIRDFSLSPCVQWDWL